MIKKLLLVVGTRPNYIKITQFKKVALASFKGRFDIKIVHTGQHFDTSMADVFFKQLDLQPDYFLDIPKASANVQIAEIMIRLEKLCLDFQPNLMIVPGDVNSTLAAALTANKLNIPLAHLESGLRSFDRSMPEEINRILVDGISNFHFVTEMSGIQNLKKEGKPNDHIYYVGNTMIDTLVAFEEEIKLESIITDLNLEKNQFILITLHRPATVDNKDGVNSILSLLKKITSKIKVVFPMHPRTLKNIIEFNLKSDFDALENLKILGPLDYFSFQSLIENSKMVLTDSGGIQEETTYRKIPCLTLRPNTERPSTVDLGTNILMNFDEDLILNHVEDVLSGDYKLGTVPENWDGQSTKRILDVIDQLDLNN